MYVEYGTKMLLKIGIYNMKLPFKKYELVKDVGSKQFFSVMTSEVRIREKRKSIGVAPVSDTDISRIPPDTYPWSIHFFFLKNTRYDWDMA